MERLRQSGFASFPRRWKPFALFDGPIVVESRRLSSATTNPASTRTVPAIRSRFKVLLLSRAQITREAVYGANQVADQFHRSKKTSSGLAPGLQSFANDIGF